MFKALPHGNQTMIYKRNAQAVVKIRDGRNQQRRINQSDSNQRLLPKLQVLIHTNISRAALGAIRIVGIPYCMDKSIKSMRLTRNKSSSSNHSLIFMCKCSTILALPYKPGAEGSGTWEQSFMDGQLALRPEPEQLLCSIIL